MLLTLAITNDVKTLNCCVSFTYKVVMRHVCTQVDLLDGQTTQCAGESSCNWEKYEDCHEKECDVRMATDN